MLPTVNQTTSRPPSTGDSPIKPIKASKTARTFCAHDEDGTLKSLSVLRAHLSSFKQKQSLHKACDDYGLKYSKSTTVAGLHDRLENYWYPGGHPRAANTSAPAQIAPRPSTNAPASSLPSSTSPLLVDFKTAIDCVSASSIPITFDGLDPLLACFKHHPATFSSNPEMCGDDIWETDLNRLMHSVFGWAVTQREISSLLRNGKDGVSAFYTFVQYFVDKRGVNASLFAPKVNALITALNALSSPSLDPPTTPSRVPTTTHINDTQIDPTLLRVPALPVLSGELSSDIAAMESAEIAANEDDGPRADPLRRRRQPRQRLSTVEDDIRDLTEAELLQSFGSTDSAQELLGYGDDDDDDDSDDDEGNGPVIVTEEERLAYERQVRVAAVDRSELNRREGGIKTQCSVVKDWHRFLAYALKAGRIRDKIIDNHALLVYIDYTATRARLSKKGIILPGTRVGASQMKKLFYGVLRLRKLQEADDPALKSTRPCRDVYVMDALKTRMDEALNRDREGLTEGAEDCPDIVANTFLSSVSDDILLAIRTAIVRAREVRSAVYGHTAWTCQNASGNRGDDLRALKLCEIQHFTLLHPNRETTIFALLGMQGEEKAGKRGMRTIVNPVYTTFIAHRNPEMCPIGALIIHFHWLFDHYKLCEKFEIDWTVNKSWRRIRLLSGSDPEAPYSDSSLYNLYARAFKSAGFESKIKQHLPRHLLGYQQERLGVQAEQTSRLGWMRDKTGQYGATYAPQFPKQAILGCAGYKDHETYDPVWRHIKVPDEFLGYVCPMAEDILPTVQGKANRLGTTKFWEAVILMRPFLFQCAAAIYQSSPKSALFRLPALARADVRAWMTNIFPSELEKLEKAVQEPVDLERIKDANLRRVLQQYETHLQRQNILLDQYNLQLATLQTLVERRTALLSSAKGFSQETYARRLGIAKATQQKVEHVMRVYSTPPSSTSSSPLRARCQNHGGHDSDGPTQVDFVLPQASAFMAPGELNPVWPTILGTRSTSWEKDIFPHIKQPSALWAAWGPSKTLNSYGSVSEVWEAYNTGEAVFDDAGIQTGLKPPIRLVEQHFQSAWRAESMARKQFSRFREIPEWIDNQSRSRFVAPSLIIHELEERMVKKGDPSQGDEGDGSGASWGLNRLQQWVKVRREADHLAAARQQKVGTMSGLSLLPAFGDEEGESVVGKKRVSVAPRGKYISSKKQKVI